MVFDDLNALSEPIRVRLLLLLDKHELGVGELSRILQLPQSTVSRHLKVLLTGGWVQRRSVSTSSYFHMPIEFMTPASIRLWAVVKEQVNQGAEFAEDKGRLEMVLSMRTPGDVGFFRREASRWEAVRTDLFGTDYLVPLFAHLLPANLRVADLGCGTGELVAHLAGSVGDVVGVDQEPAMLKLAQQRVANFSNVTLFEGGLDKLPLQTNSVDLAICSLVLHHVEALEEAFSEIHRVLDEGGRLIVMDMLAHGRSQYKTSMGHVHLGFEEDSLRESMGEAGLVLETVTALPLSPDVKGPGLFVASAKTWE